MDNVGNRFFGRERIVREIVMGVLAPQPTSFSIVGTKYTGKTLLLQHLTAPDGPLHGEEFDAWRPAGFADGRAVISTIVDCSWSDVRSDLMGYLVTHVRRQLETDEGIDLEAKARIEREMAERSAGVPQEPAAGSAHRESTTPARR